MTKIYILIIILLGIILTILGFVLGLSVGNSPEFIFVDPIEFQRRLNIRIKADPWIATELLEVDGKIGKKTIEAWERASAMEVSCER